MSRRITPEDLVVIRAANDEHSRPLRSTGVMVPCPVVPPAEMTIISIEEWSSHVAIRWWFSTPAPSTDIDLRLQDGLRWTVVDETGAIHVGGDHGGGGGNSRCWVATALLAPALDIRWSRIDLSIASPINSDPINARITRPDIAGHGQRAGS